MIKKKYRLSAHNRLNGYGGNQKGERKKGGCGAGRDSAKSVGRGGKASVSIMWI
jgi:hypothetical protein